jgi:hypothetical protein
MRFNFKLAVVAGVAATAFAVSAGAAVAAIGVSTAPGTAAPPSALAWYKMTPFPNPDPQPPGLVTSVALPVVTTGHPLSRPTGSITFNKPLTHFVGLAGFSAHGYLGSTYFSLGDPDPDTLTILLPAKTGAFYLYALPNLFSTQVITAVGVDSTGHTVTRSVAVTSPGGAQYFGFFNTTGGSVSSITISKPPDGTSFGIGIGEFGISNQMLTKIT